MASQGLAETCCSNRGDQTGSPVAEVLDERCEQAYMSLITRATSQHEPTCDSATALSIVPFLVQTPPWLLIGRVVGVA